MTRPMNVAEAANVVGCHRNTIYSALLAGELKGYQRAVPRGRWRIFAEDLDYWLRGGEVA